MRQAMIFAAGLGTRLKPLTDTMPKALVKVDGEPLLKHVILKMRKAGIERIVVNVHHFAQQIIDYIKKNDGFGIDIFISDETEALLETGGGIKKALHFFNQDSPVLIHNVDILSNADLSLFYEQAQGSDATLLVSERKTKRYLLFDDEMVLKGWTNIETGELKGPSTLVSADGLSKYAFSGIHVLSPSLFPRFCEMPDRFGIIDFYLKYCSHYQFKGYMKKDLRLMDVGKIDTLYEAEEFIKNI